MSLPSPIESYHFQANLIWWDSPFKINHERNLKNVTPKTAGHYLQDERLVPESGEGGLSPGGVDEDEPVHQLVPAHPTTLLPPPLCSVSHARLNKTTEGCYIHEQNQQNTKFGSHTQHSS